MFLIKRGFCTCELDVKFDVLLHAHASTQSVSPPSVAKTRDQRARSLVAVLAIPFSQVLSQQVLIVTSQVKEGIHHIHICSQDGHNA